MTGIQSIKVDGQTWNIGDMTQFGRIIELDHNGLGTGGWKALIKDKGYFRISILRKISKNDAGKNNQA